MRLLQAVKGHFARKLILRLEPDRAFVMVPVCKEQAGSRALSRRAKPNRYGTGQETKAPTILPIRPQPARRSGGREEQATFEAMQGHSDAYHDQRCREHQDLGSPDPPIGCLHPLQ